MTLPTSIILGFLLLAAGSYALERTEIAWLEPTRRVLRAYVFADAKATSDLLSTIAGGLITITSITFSLLLAVQQSAASMTSKVFDKFLRRWHNQASFGFFIGLALYTLVVLATVDEPFNPLYGASLAVLLTVIALFLLILLLYTTINQIRPVEIIEAIHDYTLAARARQQVLLRKTRRTPCYNGPVRAPIRAPRHGFVTRIDVHTLGAATEAARGEVEVVLWVSIGPYAAFQDVIAEVRAQTLAEAMSLGDAVRGAIRFERQRDLGVDPAYGIEQLEMIAWTSFSTSKSNPAPGLLTIRALRDVLARWSNRDEGASDERPVPVVYTDNAFARLMGAFESLAVVSSESLQHQNFTEVVHTFAVMFDRLPWDQQPRAEDLIRRILSSLGEHVLTAELNAARSASVATLTTSARFETATAVQVAQDRLGRSVGKLSSRSTRSADGR